MTVEVEGTAVLHLCIADVQQLSRKWDGFNVVLKPKNLHSPAADLKDACKKFMVCTLSWRTAAVITSKSCPLRSIPTEGRKTFIKKLFMQPNPLLLRPFIHSACPNHSLFYQNIAKWTQLHAATMPLMIAISWSYFWSYVFDSLVHAEVVWEVSVDVLAFGCKKTSLKLNFTDIIYTYFLFPFSEDSQTLL